LSQCGAVTRGPRDQRINRPAGHDARLQRNGFAPPVLG